MSWLDVGFRLCDMDTLARPRLDSLLAASAACGPWLPLRGVCVIGDRPTVLKREQEGRLHCSSGPAIAYADGYELWAWHGMRVPSWVVTEPTPERIAAEPNVETRRCAIEAFGWERFGTAAGLVRVAGPVPDIAHPVPSATVELFDVPERLWGAAVRMVLVHNASPEPDGSYRRYGLTVPADISDPIAALAWTAGVEPDLYRQLARAS